MNNFNKVISLVIVWVFLFQMLTIGYVYAENEDIDGVHTEKEILEVKQYIQSGNEDYALAYNQFLIRANEALNRTPSAIEDYYIPGFYVDPDGHINNSKALTGDAYAAYTAALAYRLSDDERYAEKAREILNDWASTNKNLSLSDDTPLVSAYSGVGLINAAELLEGYEDWTASEQNVFKSWVTSKYQVAVDSIKDRNNNWATWGNLAAITTYCYLNDTAGINREIERLKTIIGQQIHYTGYLPKEAERGNNSMWYHYIALAPMTATAQIAFNAVGSHVYEYSTSSGASLKKALDYYKNYVENPSTWPHYEEADLKVPTLSNGQNSGDYTNWPTNLYAAMSRVFKDPGYADLVDDYVPVLGGWNNERGAHHIAWCFPSLMKPYYEIKNFNFIDSFDGSKVEHWTVNAGTWEIRNGEYCQNDENGLAVSITGEPYWSNYTVSSDIKMSSAGGEVGIYFRYQNDLNYYRMLYSADEKSLKFQKSVQGEVNDIVAAPTTINIDEFNNFKLIAKDDTFYFYINGKDIIYQVKDSSISKGKVGVFTNNTAANFDNFMALYSVAIPSKSEIIYSENFENISSLEQGNWLVTKSKQDGNGSASLSVDPDDSNNHCIRLADWDSNLEVSAVQSFAPITSGIITVGFKVKIPNTDSASTGIHFKNDTSTAVISLMRSGAGGFAYRPSTGAKDDKVFIWMTENFDKKKWYDVKVVMNMDTQTADVYLNNTIRNDLKNIGFRTAISSFDRISLQTDKNNANTTIYYDDFYIGYTKSFDVEKPAVDTNAENQIIVNSYITKQYEDNSPVVIIAAAYDEAGTLLAVNSVKFNEDSSPLEVYTRTPFTILLDTNGIIADKVQLFCWDNLQDMKPLMNHYTVDLH